ncbi:hypothetical protein ACFLS0_07800, partial [Candidatus Bipolaricaulota bacterium]
MTGQAARNVGSSTGGRTGRSVSAARQLSIGALSLIMLFSAMSLTLIAETCSTSVSSTEIHTLWVEKKTDKDNVTYGATYDDPTTFHTMVDPGKKLRRSYLEIAIPSYTNTIILDLGCTNIEAGSNVGLYTLYAPWNSGDTFLSAPNVKSEIQVLTGPTTVTIDLSLYPDAVHVVAGPSGPESRVYLGLRMTNEDSVDFQHIDWTSIAGTVGGYECPKILIEKLTNGESADDAPGPYVEVGAPVTWTYEVTNAGGVPLDSMTVSDNQGVTPVYLSGDTDGDDMLDTDEIWTYTATGTATLGQYENTGTASAQFDGS